MPLSTDAHPACGATRREFCAYASQAASLITIGALMGCGGGQTSPSAVSTTPAPSIPATLSGRLVTIALDQATALANVGSGGVVQNALGSFLVARTGSDSYTAFSGICTHEACTITGFAGGRFVCPCHGSQFTTAGAVVNGPATRSLSHFPTAVDGNLLTFTV